MQKSIIKALAVLAAGAFFYLLFLRPYSTPQIHLLQGTTMGTTWHVQVVANEAQTAQEAGAAIKGLLAHLDRGVFSTWTEDSELSRLNRSQPHVAHPVSPELLEVLQLAQAIYRNSRNTFDVSIGPLVNLWGFGPAPVTGVPDEDAIAAAQAQLGLDALQVDAANGTVTFARPLTLDLAGIAEGYAVDAVADLLRDLGFDAFLAEIGGELRLRGRRPDGGNWIIAVERPEDGPPAVYTRLDTRGEAMALSVSGDYHNFREVDGQRYAHGIDPRTGRPATHALASVTVIGDTAAAADAWSTALMVLGPEEGMEVADSEGLAAYFIMRAPTGFQHTYTPAFARYLQQVPDVPNE
jgi:FAD:protein FMN transferase